MTAADKIAEARALIKPLTGNTPGPWWRDCWDVMGRGGGTGHVCEVSTPNGDDERYWASGEADANTRLIAAAPDLRNTVADLADLADAQAQEIQAAASQAIDRMEAEVRSILADFFRRGVAQEKWEDAAALAARRTRAALGEAP